MDRENIPVGWHRNIKDERYHASNGVSSSSLKWLLKRAPNTFLYRKQEKTAAMAMGSLVHTMILEPEKVDANFAAIPDFGDCRKKENKAAKEFFYSRNADKELVKAADWNDAKGMTESVLNHPTASILLQDSIVESSIYWWYKGDYEDDRNFKQVCKVRPDSIPVTHPGMLVDIKTTNDASYTEFAKAIHKYLYHLSAAMYLEGVNQCNELLDHMKCHFFTNFIFIVVEKEYPYNVACYQLSKEDLRIGRELFKKAMQVLHDAKENDFPGYPEEVREIELPQYARKGHIV